MHDFAVLALLALAVMVVIDFLGDYLGDRIPAAILTFVAAIAAVWVLDYSVFTAWDVAIDNGDFGTVLTGFMVAGLTLPWRALLGYLRHDSGTGSDSGHLRRAA